MTDRSSFEQRIGALIAAIADRAPVDVDPLDMTRLVAGGSRRFGPVWIASKPFGRGVGVAVVLVAVVVALVAGTLVAGGQLLRRDPGDVLTERAFVEPFLGLPPEGAAPSTPETGGLVVSFGGRVDSLGMDFHRMWLYADGRLIWKSNLEGSRAGWAERFGASEPTTAVIEQWLTPEGVELMRSEVMASAQILGPALVDQDVSEWGGPGVLWGGMKIGNGDQVLAASWSDPGLPGRLANPAFWLPASAWADQRIAGFVPSRYAVCVEPGGMTDLLPEPTKDLLRSRATLSYVVEDPRCPYRVSTEDARAIVATLDAAAFQPQGASMESLRYRFPASGFVELLPIVPDGDMVCNCG